MHALTATMLVGLVPACAPTDDPSLAGGSGGPSEVSGASPAARSADLPRIVSLIPSVTELIVELDARESLVARTDFDRQPELSDLPSVGGGLDPNLEALIGVGAEVVLVAATRDASALGQRIEALGIHAIPVEIQTIDDMYATLGALGDLLAREQMAEALVQSIAHDLDEVRRRVAGRDPVPVFYVVWSDPPMTAGGDTFVDEVIRIAGGRNVFEDAPLQWPTVGFESIVDRGPAVILWPRGDRAEADVTRLRTVPGWRDVEAVQAGRVVLVDADTFNRPGPSVVQAALDLARVLHPDVW